MKKQIILFVFLLPCLAFGYNWTLFGPSGIKTNDICFNAGAGYTVICREDGICVSDGTGSAWSSYTNGGMPAWEAVHFDNENILLVMGDGSMLDGIYKFNLMTHQFIVMKLVTSPTFIKFCTTNQTYYAGSKYDGLMTSANGSDWNFVPFFISQQITSMDFYENHLVISKGFQFQTIYYSSDTGRTWNLGDGWYINYLAFHPNGKLYGIIPWSNSASLRESSDFGHTWDLCYWSDDINTVGFDAAGSVLVGWRHTFGDEEGIARYDTALSSMTFYNEGLPNKFINRIRTNPVMSSIAIFCCTDTGVYFSNDYWTGIPYNSGIDIAGTTRSFPNPCTSTANIAFCFPEYHGNTFMLSMYNSTGVLVKEGSYRIDRTDKNCIGVDVTRFPAGIYYYSLKAGKYEAMNKMVVSNVFILQE